MFRQERSPRHTGGVRVGGERGRPMHNPRPLVESALLAALAAVLFLVSSALPLVGIAAALICPTPLVVLGLRHSLRHALLGTVVAGLLTVIFSGPLGGLFFTLGFGVLGVGLGVLARKYANAEEILLYGILISLGSKLLLMGAATAITGINPFSVDPEQMRLTMQQAFDMVGGWGGQGSSAALEPLRTQMEASFQMIPLIFPALLVMAGAMDCWLSYAVSGIVLRRLGEQRLPPILPFDTWRFPRSLVWALLASILFPLLDHGGHGRGILFRAGVNLRMVVTMLFLLQGMAVLGNFLRRWNWGKARWVAFFLVMALPLLSQGATVLGIADMWFDFRARKPE